VKTARRPSTLIMAAWTTPIIVREMAAPCSAAGFCIFKSSFHKLALLALTSYSVNAFRAMALSESGSDKAQTSAWVSVRTLTCPRSEREGVALKEPAPSYRGRKPPGSWANRSSMADFAIAEAAHI